MLEQKIFNGISIVAISETQIMIGQFNTLTAIYM